MRLHLVTTLLVTTMLGSPLPLWGEEPEQTEEPPSSSTEIIEIEESPTYIEQDDYVEEETKEQILVDLPMQENNSFKSYMDYRTITDTSSNQWEMQQEAYTDEYGLRKIGEYYCVALGSGISDELGDKFEITFDTGETIKVIMAEQKADCHTDITNKYIDRGDGSINIVEFIVQTEMMPWIVGCMGDISYMPGEIFAGNIITMEEIT